MKTLKFLPGSLALAFGAAIMIAPPASADPYCYSVGLFSSCAEIPSYNTPTPPPTKPMPVWVCKTVISTQLVFSTIPGLIPSIISRVLVYPTVECIWQ